VLYRVEKGEQTAHTEVLYTVLLKDNLNFTMFVTNL